MTALRCVPLLILILTAGCSPTFFSDASGTGLPYAIGSALYCDNFSGDLSNWLAEGQQPTLADGKMDLDAPVGTTVWFRPELSGNVLIEYDVTVIDKGGPNDRVSDLNCFWMATDPASPDNLFAARERRGGTFRNYDPLNLYYVGYGGNTNSTTRFRKYQDGQRTMLGEYTDPIHLIEANRMCHIQLVFCEGVVEYYIDGERLFHYLDADPYARGHFGLRTVQNHLVMDNFCVVRIGPLRPAPGP